MYVLCMHHTIRTDPNSLRSYVNINGNRGSQSMLVNSNMLRFPGTFVVARCFLSLFLFLFVILRGCVRNIHPFDMKSHLKTLSRLDRERSIFHSVAVLVSFQA